MKPEHEKIYSWVEMGWEFNDGRFTHFQRAWPGDEMPKFRAQKHVERVLSGELRWIVLAKIYVLEYLLEVHACVDVEGGLFTVEGLREWAYERGMLKATDARAWSPAVQAAAKKNLCWKTEIEVPTSNPKAHRREIAVWSVSRG